MELVALPKTERVCKFEEPFHLQIDRSRVFRKFQPQGLPRTSPQVTMRKAGVGSQFGGFRSVVSLEERNYRDKGDPKSAKFIHLGGPSWCGKCRSENPVGNPNIPKPLVNHHYPSKNAFRGAKKNGVLYLSQTVFYSVPCFFPTKSQLFPSAWRQQHFRVLTPT